MHHLNTNGGRKEHISQRFKIDCQVASLVLETILPRCKGQPASCLHRHSGTIHPSEFTACILCLALASSVWILCSVAWAENLKNVVVLGSKSWSVLDCETSRSDCQTSRSDCETWIVKLAARIVKLVLWNLKIGLWNLRIGLWNSKVGLWNSGDGLWN